MRPSLTLLTLLCLHHLAVAAPVPQERLEADKLVGTWKLVKSSNPPLDGVTVTLRMELTASGKMILRQSVNGGPESVYEGEYKMSKNEIGYSIKYPDGTIKKETLTIKKLNETDLSVVDPDGIQEDFERLKPKKEDSKPMEKK